MMRKPNYNMERKDRERAKQAKAAAKAEKRAAKGAEAREGAPSTAHDEARPDDGESTKPAG
jgi:hypothetical protein